MEVVVEGGHRLCWNGSACIIYIAFLEAGSRLKVVIACCSISYITKFATVTETRDLITVPNTCW